MEYGIELLKAHGIREIAVTLHYLPETIKNYFGDGRKFGVELSYFEEKIPLGTAGSIKNAEAFLDETFIVISGDALTDFNLAKGIAFHQENLALVTIFMKQVSKPLDYGVIKTKETGEITKFLEKPNWNEVFSDTINTGIYVVNPDIFKYLEQGVPTDFSSDLFPLLLKEKQTLFGYKAEGYWSDIGSLRTYRETQFDMLNKRVKVSLPGREISPGIWIGEDVTIEEGVSLKGPLSIGGGAVLRAGASVGNCCIVGNHTTLSSNCSLKQSILWNDVYIGNTSELRGTTICKGTKLADSVLVYEASAVGEQCTIGAKAIIKPEVKVWPNKAIEEETIVDTSLMNSVKNLSLNDLKR